MQDLHMGKIPGELRKQEVPGVVEMVHGQVGGIEEVLQCQMKIR